MGKAEPYTLFKNPEYVNRAKKKKAKGKRYKREKRNYIDINNNTVTRQIMYENLSVADSYAAQDKFCDITGFECSHTHVKHFLNYLDLYVYKYIKNLQNNKKDEFRSIRNIKQGF